MTKRSSKSTKSSDPIRNIITAILVVVVIAVATLITNVTGIDVLSLLGVTTPVPTALPTIVSVPGSVTPISIPLGYGAEKGFWEVLFTAPSGSSDRSTYVNGIDTQLAAAINGTQRTLDIAAFEFNNPVLTQAVLNAKSRGVTVRVVTDNEHGIGDDDTTLNQFVAAGIPVIDDARGGLMHNKFMILDSSVVWTGSWNYTINGTYRNNNNALAMRSRRAVEIYQAEFNEMFVNKEFGSKRSAVNGGSFNQDGTPVQVLFAPEDEVVPTMIQLLSGAKSSIRFMAFSFTLSDVGNVLLNQAQNGVSVTGIFETTGSETAFSELTPLFCAGLPVRQDGNGYVFHHKVFIVDDTTVLTGSFNFSASARDSNDENIVIISDPDLAAQYIAEFNRRWAEAKTPEGLTCQ
ncbi:MAG: phospholipase [Anaerolineaceae bacterium]|nr:phospholipase [Anaerolineaceae bacterium]